MALRTAGSVLVVFLWSVAVVLGQNGWSVTYTTQSICTLKGSTVELSCSYTYPRGYIVTTTLWFTKIIDVENYVSLLDDPDYKGRVTYRSDKTNGHTLTITHLRESDSATYMFRFITDQTGGKYVGSPGVTLSVTDLQVKVTTTWWSTTLTCSTTCTLTDNPTYIWYRNSKNVQEDSSPLYSVDLKTEDSFYCAVKGINSPAVYGPKNTSVSVSPSGEIVEGSSVNLTCSSDANPPVDKYTWYKITYKKMSMRHSGQRYTIHNISSEDREGYYCEALNIIGREHIPVHINVIYTAAVLPWVPVVGVGAVLTVGALLLTIYCCMKMRSTGGSDATADTQNVRDSPVTQPLRKMLSPPIIRTEENDHRTWNEENNHRTWTEENHHRTWTEQNHHIP
ncbi:cell surface A33 antigen-like [Salvelinus alpinus]|uniref:cell surface A33 antigen-like n=1 Tax=Salvelinus alpinus TaxID=8036 RepID=UPI0039FD551A